MKSTTLPAGLREAQLLAARGETTAALQAVETLLARDPADVNALLLRGRLLLDAREEEAALEAFRRAAGLAPASAEAQDGLARCLHAMGRDDEALSVALAARAQLARPENFAQSSPVYLTLVWIYREQRRYREALAMAEEGLERCPDAVLAQWASVVEEELLEAQQERC